MKYLNKIVSLLFLLSIIGCVKQEFDEPPLGGEPANVTANQTIAGLKAIHVLKNRETITEDWIIGGEVVMDDRSGNYYKSIVIQDETGGLDIKFNDGYLSTDYPIGRKVYINVKGMVLTDYNELIQLIGGVLTSGGTVQEIGITAAQRETAVFKGPIAATKLVPATRTVSTITQADVGTLIRLTDVEFTTADAGKSFAEPVAQLTLNRNLEDCNGKQLLVRTSGYADFAGQLTPTGKGDFVAVLSKYRSDYQLYIRNLDDVAGMTGDRCGSGGVGGDLNQVDISVIRSSFNGSVGAGPDKSKIKGVVISSVTDGNITSRNLVIQDGTAGIAVRFAANHSFVVGDQIEINVSGVEVSEFSGLLQLNNVANGLASKVGTAVPNVRTATVLDIMTNANTWESTLVKIVDAELSGGATFSGNNGTVTVKDASGTIPMYTRSAALFAGDALPSGKVVVTAILGDFNGVQLNMRNRADVTGGTIGGGGTGGTDPLTSLDEKFEGQTNNQAIAISQWTNVAQKGTRTWLGKLFSGNTYAQATSYNSTDAAEDMWLITPKLNLSAQRTLTFESAKAFWTHNGLSVVVSTDFDGTNIGSATWLPLTATLAVQGDTDNAFIPSGNVVLPIATKGYVAFRYQGTGAANTGTYRIDNVVIK